MKLVAILGLLAISAGDVREVEAVAVMVAAIAYYLRTKKMPRKNAGQVNTKTL